MKIVEFYLRAPGWLQGEKRVKLNLLNVSVKWSTLLMDGFFSNFANQESRSRSNFRFWDSPEKGHGQPQELISKFK